MIKTSLSPEAASELAARLEGPNAAFLGRYPGETGRRQPVHTVYGGAHLFKADSAKKLGALALKALEQYAPDPIVFAHATRLVGAERLPDDPAEAGWLARQGALSREANRPAWLAHTIYARVVEKLRREPVEDFRIDFEDGYGNRPDAEEDGHAAAAAEQVAKGMEQGTLPPFLGIRVKPFTEELKRRALRTLDIFLSTLAAAGKGEMPSNFVVTIPKVQIPEQVAVLADACDLLEPKLRLAAGSLKLELMIETTQSILGPRGESNLPLLLDAARGRCVAAHFGTYDYTASCNITAAHQRMDHPSCDFAKHLMQVAFAGTGVWLSDGATNIMPVAPHKAEADGPPLTAQQVLENRAAVHRAWRLHYQHIQHSLTNGYYQGWDLHPAQLPTRYAAVYAFFLTGLAAASDRLRNFVEKAAQATLIGDVFDDAATGQGLLNYFLRGWSCGALTEDEALATGVTLDELRGRSFVKILKNRRK